MAVAVALGPEKGEMGYGLTLTVRVSSRARKDATDG